MVFKRKTAVYSLLIASKKNRFIPVILGVIGFIFCAGLSPNWILPETQQLYLRRVRSLPQAGQLSSLKNEPLISQWNLLFSKMAKDAKIHPEQYKTVELFFVREDDSIERMPFFIPNGADDEDLDTVVTYLAAKVNNYIVTHSAKKIYVKSGLENIYKKLNSYFQQNYRRKDARITVADISAVYSGTNNFEVLPYQEVLRTGVLNGKTHRRKSTNTQKMPIGHKSTNIVINIGKTKIKFAIARIEKDGSYNLSSIIDIDTWKEGEDMTQYSLIQKKVMAGINKVLQQSGLSIKDIDGIGLGAAAIVKNGAPLPLRTGFPTFFSNESLKELTSICDTISKTFGNLPVVMGNDGDMEALSIARTNQYKNTLVLKFGTTLAAGYIDERGNIPEGLNEINKVIIDLSKDAFLQDSTQTKGNAGRYISWVGIENIARALGLYEKYGFSPADKVPKILRLWLKNGTAEQKEDACKVFSEVGKYIGVMTDEIARYSRVDNVTISGGLVAGRAGEIIAQSANDYIQRIISGTTISVSLSSDGVEVLRYGGLIGAGYLISDLITRINSEQGKVGMKNSP